MHDHEHQPHDSSAPLALVTAAACGGQRRRAPASAAPCRRRRTSAQANTGLGTGPRPRSPRSRKDARKDFLAAMRRSSRPPTRASWNESACRQARPRSSQARRARARRARRGAVHGRASATTAATCSTMPTQGLPAGDRDEGRRRPSMALALSNLGEIYYRAARSTAPSSTGSRRSRRTASWSPRASTSHRSSSSSCARPPYKDPKWKKLEEDARLNLSHVLGVESDNVEAYTRRTAWSTWRATQKNKNRLDLAKLLLDEAKKRNEKYAPLQNAYGLYYMHRDALIEALQYFQAAVEADPKFVEARMNVGPHRRSGSASTTSPRSMFAKVARAPAEELRRVRSAWGSRSAASRISTAPRPSTRRRMQTRSAHGRGYYNLGVLYKDFRANKQNDPDPIKALRGRSYATAKAVLLQPVPRQGWRPRRQGRGQGQIGD